MSQKSLITSWESSIAKNIREKISTLADKKRHQPFVIAISGIPGSGKSTSSKILSSLLHELQISNMIVPMDGFHYPIKVLETFENPKDVIYRRGAEDTFDSSALLSTLTKIKFGKDNVVKIPGFDHAKGDPDEDMYVFQRGKHLVVICEGLYLLHWNDLRPIFDHTIFIDADLDTCISLLKIRNQCIPGYTKEEIELRCEEVDRLNALVVLKTKSYADRIVKSAGV